MKRLLPVLFLLVLPFAASGQHAVAVKTSGDSRVAVPSLVPRREALQSLASNELELSIGPSTNLRAIWTGREFVVFGNGAGGLQAIRVDENGGALGTPLLIDARGVARDIAFDGVNVLAVYLDDGHGGGYGSSLYARRVSSVDGELRLIDAAPILISRAEFPLSGWIYDASVSYGNGSFLVAWSRQYAQTFDVATVRITPGGVIAGEPYSLSSPGNYEWSPRSAFDGRNFFVVWMSPSLIGGTFIDPLSGAAKNAITIFESTNPSQAPGWPHVAWNGSHYLVAWSVGMWPNETRVTGTRVTADGALPDGAASAGGGFNLPTSDDPQIISSISWDGRDFVLSWNAGSYQCQWSPCPRPEYRMRFARVGSEGRQRYAVPRELGWGIMITHSSDSAGKTLFVYEKDERIWVHAFAGRSRERPVRR